MKNFIKSRTSSSSNQNPKLSSKSSDPKNPVIVHLSMQQQPQQQLSHNNTASQLQSTVFAPPASNSIDTQQIYLNPSEIYQPNPSYMDPIRHQFEPPNISLATGVQPVIPSRTASTVLQQQQQQQTQYPPPQNFGLMSTEVTPQATPIASKKLQNNHSNNTSGDNSGSGGGFSNYMPMSDCSSQNTNDSGRGTHEQNDVPNSYPMAPQNAMYHVDNAFYDEISNERKLRHQVKSKQHKNMKKYFKEKSTHHRRSRRMGRSLSASSLSTVEKNRAPRRSKERGGVGIGGGHTYKVYDGDFLTKPGNLKLDESSANVESGLSSAVASSKYVRGRQNNATNSIHTRSTKHESEHFEVLDSSHERERSLSNYTCNNCQCEQTLELVARKVELLKLAILEKMEYCQGNYDRRADELDKKVRHQLNSLDKIFKERLNIEKNESIQRMDKKILQERMAIAEEIRKTEMRVDRSLKDWCESRYQRVEGRLQGGSTERAHSDSGLSRRHSFGDGSSSIGTGDSNKCYRDSGAFECSSTASNSDSIGVKTPSDSFPIKTPWNNNPRSSTKRESPLISSGGCDQSTASSTRSSIQSPGASSTGASLSASKNRCTSPITSSANLSIHSPSSSSKADSISDILDSHISDVHSQQYGTVRRKSRHRLETTTTALDDTESCFGDNESVSQIPILTLPSEHFGKMAAAATQHSNNKPASMHQRSSSSFSSVGPTGNFFIAPSNQLTQTPNPRTTQMDPNCHIADITEDLRHFNSQYLGRSSTSAAKCPVATAAPNQRCPQPSFYEEKQFPPCDFEKMKRLDSAANSPLAPQKSNNVPPVLPPRGLEMSRTQPSSQGNPEERDALLRRIRELEETLQRVAVSPNPTTNPNPNIKAI